MVAAGRLKKWVNMMQCSKFGFLSFLRRFRGDRRGASVLVFALTLPIMIGFLGLGSEVAYWYVNQRTMQTAADFGAFSAAVDLRGGKLDSYAMVEGKSEALDNGADAATDTVTVNIPPLSGAITTSDAAEVIIVRSLPRLFSAIFVDEPMSITARGVAQYSAGNSACFVALRRSADFAVDISGSADIILHGCDVQSNSSSADAARITGSATLTTGCISAAGGISASAGLTLTDCSVPDEGAALSLDPYESLPMPDLTGPCATLPAGSPTAAHTFSPGRYCGGLTLQGTETLQPGVYIIDGGDFEINSTAVVNGTDVTFILTGGGTVSMNGAAEINLAAPTDPADPYVGILFYQDRDEPDATNSINGNSDSNFEGVFYFPSQGVTFNGTSAAGPGCMLLVANTVKVTGTSTLGNNCVGSSFFGDVTSAGYVRLVE